MSKHPLSSAGNLSRADPHTVAPESSDSTDDLKDSLPVQVPLKGVHLSPDAVTALHESLHRAGHLEIIEPLSLLFRSCGVVSYSPVVAVATRL
ncbi:hypothetical protein MRX96_012312 [Rhipicephalus microplus]